MKKSYIEFKKPLEVVYQDWLLKLREEKMQKKQTDGQLRHEGKFCCLGVLCSTLQKTGDGKYLSKTDEFFIGEVNESVVLPDSLRESIFMTGTEQSRLIEMNDSDGKSFKEIADYVEKKIMPSALTRYYKAVDKGIV